MATTPKTGTDGTISIDFASTNANDLDRGNETDIQPWENGEPIRATTDADPTRRPTNNLRKRVEKVRAVVDEILYTSTVDRAFGIFPSNAAATLTWNGTPSGGGDGKFALSPGHSVYLLPFLGVGDSGQTPPVASTQGKVTIYNTNNPAVDIIEITSTKYAYEGGDRMNVTVVQGTPLSIDLYGGGTDVVITIPANTNRLVLQNALDAYILANPGYFTAVSTNGGNNDIVATMSKTYVTGHWDSEAHVLSKAELDAFFGVNPDPDKDLEEGDSLCIRYQKVTEEGGTGGRRQSLVENNKQAVTAGMLFNSRIYPEYLPNSIPFAKVVGDRLYLTNGTSFAKGVAAAVVVGNVTAADVTYAGTANNWADGTTNPATTVEAQLDNIATYLGGAGGAGKIGFTPGNGSNLAASTVKGALDELDVEKGGLNLPNSWLKPNLFKADLITDVSPILSVADTAYNAKSVFDRIGYPSGRRTEYRQTWPGNGTTIAAAANAFMPLSGWQVYGDSASVDFPFAVTTALTNANIYDTVAVLYTNNTITKSVCLRQLPVVAPRTTHSIVFEVEVGVSSLTNIANRDFAIGLAGNAVSDGGASDLPSHDYFVIMSSAGGANWVFSTKNDAGSTMSAAADAGTFAPTVNSQRVRIELHGAATPYGAKAYFFIDGTLVKTMTTTLPITTAGASLNFLGAGFSVVAAASAAGPNMYVGPVYMSWGRYLNALL